MRILVSILFLVLSIGALYVAADSYREAKKHERILCFMILDRFGEKDKDCQEYVKEWKEFQ